MSDRIPFWQAESRDRHASHRTNNVYSTDHCGYCGRPVKPDAPRLRVTRTNDGEWWLLTAPRAVADDEVHFGHFGLPIGPDCLRKHPEFRAALVSAATPTDPERR